MLMFTHSLRKFRSFNIPSDAPFENTMTVSRFQLNAMLYQQ